MRFYQIKKAETDARDKVADFLTYDFSWIFLVAGVLGPMFIRYNHIYRMSYILKFIAALHEPQISLTMTLDTISFGM